MCIFPEKGPLVCIRFSKYFKIPQKLRIALVYYVLAGTDSSLENTGLGHEPPSLALLGSPPPLTLEIPGEIGAGAGHLTLWQVGKWGVSSCWCQRFLRYLVVTGLKSWHGNCFRLLPVNVKSVVNYIHLSERGTEVCGVCVQERQPRHGLKAFAIFPNWSNLFQQWVSFSLFSIPSSTACSVWLPGKANGHQDQDVVILEDFQVCDGKNRQKGNIGSVFGS